MTKNCIRSIFHMPIDCGLIGLGYQYYCSASSIWGTEWSFSLGVGYSSVRLIKYSDSDSNLDKD